ncbi:medium-chain acyl-CoA ligase ACSF2, mitochondrial-like [Brevipalpus obovatus]|uniref:medium-chain acyl-CoA ligase ACSF2, mitochondrial-like n=1 Tax=Brevipalpus obovatus TaxID=246614 RepID=UPI003D9EBFC3
MAYVHRYLSYCQNLSNTPHLIETLPEILSVRVEENGDKICLVSRDENVKKTYRELWDDSHLIATSLYDEFVIRRGDTIGIWSPNSVAWVSVKLAADILGAILCPVNPYFKVDELAFVVNHSKMKVLFMPSPESTLQAFNNFTEIVNDPKFLGQINKSLLSNIIYLDGKSEIKSTSRMKFHFLEDLSSRKYQQLPKILLDSDDSCVLMYTSGTSGKPKGVLLSTFMTVNNCHFAHKRYATDDTQDIICCPLPFFHCFGLILCLVSSIVNNCTLVLTGSRFDAESTISSIVDHCCSLLICTPTIMLDILKCIEARNISVDSLKNCILGGAPLNDSLMKRIQLVFPKLMNVYNAYGSTELSLCATLASKDDPKGKIFETNGRVIDHLECKITDTSTGNILEHNLMGELWIRGWSVMLGYHDDEEKTKNAVSISRWYKTGDIATMDCEGFITVVDRSKEMIIRGGVNIYPKEIENCLMEDSSISEAYVFGIPDQRLGEQICAWIKLEKDGSKVTPNDIKDQLKHKIAYFKIPKYVFIVQDIPRTPTFKASKLKMREMTMEKFARNHESLDTSEMLPKKLTEVPGALEKAE